MNYISSLIGRSFASNDTSKDGSMSPSAPMTLPSSSLPSPTHIPGLSLISAAQFDADFEARRAASSPAAPASKRPKLGPSISPTSSAAPRKALPSKPRGDCIAKVNDLAQAHRLRTDYDFEEGPPSAFSAYLRLLDGDQEVQSFQAPGTYGSKKAAKEKVAEIAMSWLETQSVPKKAAKDAGLLPLAAAKVDPSENWVGILHEFCQSTQRDQPEYSIYELGPQRFGATCSLLGQTHNDQNAAFSSKKIAKTAAAHATVLALRQEGILRKSGPQKRVAVTTVAPAVSAFGAPLPNSVSLATPSTPIAPGTPAAQSTPPPSAISLVPTLCASLNITPPIYKLTQTSALTPDFWDCEARFKNAVEPCLRGAVGKVERVYGKKNAKDKVVQQVLEILEGVKQQRLAD